MANDSCPSLYPICLAHQDLDSERSSGLRKRMNFALLPGVAKLFQEVDGMSPCRLIEAVDSLTQGRLRLMPTMMRHFFFQGLPRPFFEIGFRSISREVDYA